jgi:hypothetical protein
VHSERRFRDDVRLLSFMPHMHLRGSSFRYVLASPDGHAPVEVLLDGPAFDFGWQSYYVLAAPRTLPRGSLFACDATFDNSAENQANPDPTVAVQWGEQTWEEMMIGYVDIDVPIGAEAGEEPGDEAGGGESR